MTSGFSYCFFPVKGHYSFVDFSFSTFRDQTNHTGTILEVPTQEFSKEIGILVIGAKINSFIEFREKKNY